MGAKSSKKGECHIGGGGGGEGDGEREEGRKGVGYHMDGTQLREWGRRGRLAIILARLSNKAINCRRSSRSHGRV